MSEPAAAERSHRTKGLLRLTMACNERCPFCNVPVEDYPRPTPPEAETLAAVADFVARGERTLTISGGEPTLLRARLLRVVAAARSQGIPFVELQTNAVLIDTGYATALAQAGLTSAFVSLLSEQPDLHDLLAGLEGAHPRCLRGIDALVAAGVAVTLNPVVARITQDRLAAYVRFVARRLPGVRTISVSAVQPHGRAGRGEAAAELLPDYAMLALEVPRARAAAAAAGLTLVNPYCGLPLCVGWAKDPSRSVEAVEAVEGGWRPRPGVDNTGDKVHGPPCEDCAWRTRCGGAWRDYWRVRGGSGIVAPATVVAPWEPGADTAPDQMVVRAIGGAVSATWAALGQARAPTVWLHTDRLGPGQARRLRESGCTDLALELDPAGLASPRTAQAAALARTLQQLRDLARAGAGSQPQARLRCWLRLVRSAATRPADIAAVATWAQAHGLHRLVVQKPSQYQA